MPETFPTNSSSSSSSAPSDGAPIPVSNFGLKFSYWWVTHKFMLRRVLGGALIAVSIGLYAYSGWQAFQLFFVDQQAYRQLLGTLRYDYIDYAAFRQRNAARPLEIVDYAAVGGRDGRYDLIVQLRNPNPQYAAARVTVRFLSNGEPIGERQTFVLPNDSKYLGLFGMELGSAPNPEVELVDVEWNRVHDYEAFAGARLGFEVDDARFYSPSELGLTQSAPVSSATFHVRNSSAFSFWRVGFSVILRSGSAIIGANYITAEQFRAGEERDLEVRWSEPLPAASDVEVIPEVDILDPSVYLPPQ